MARVLILGCGYTGRRLAERLLENGHEVTGTTRSPERVEALRSLGVRPLRVDVAEPESVAGLRSVAPEACVYLVPPQGAEDETPGLDRVMDALGRAPLECFVYVSSTSVYGDRDGGWVDETDLPEPDSPNGRARLAAERAVLRHGWTHDCRPRIVRPAGIYGPGRTLRRRLREGNYQLVEGTDPYANRIHVEDLAAALEAAWHRGSDGRIYNACDDEPHPSAEYARFTAGLLGLEIPTITLEEARERYSESALARKLGSKRVSNRRLREELEVELRYPTYREGVPEALREEGVELSTRGG